MATIYDVARYITEKQGEMSAMKLQKLMYYAQAWHLVWEEQPLFPDMFEAWANGPVLPAIYDKHRGQFKVDKSFFRDGNATNLSKTEKENIGKVLEFYGDKTAQWLSNLTHQEDPWLKARGDTPIGAPSNAEISLSAIHEYYSSL
ncbi:Panacea domain-containing protein [Permianibacter aggregans]|uniref:Putative phage-associated protein n=1 Tax=Permianibacter aggregans TaxID=1510150 RepID=A0A4R6URX5_9GAMM|nr:type II toxin-antitoxin system antitoxin SocA domain-containing protein [Permianibacter aggregans]QGX39443.1 DUF4065 domain-containing protein [Permianibacter aggregans]TDQ49821.1 putative phage-associated protein [Permianibacter aggregans]